MNTKFTYPLSEKDNILLEPYTYTSKTPGKGIRGALIQAFNYWLKVDDVVVQKISNVIQILHMSSLLIDDIEDNSKLRRGIPTAHTVYGIPQTINCANFVYFLTMQEINALGNSEATTIYIDELIKSHRGQGYDIYWRDSNQCPTEEEYKMMALEKTGGLFRLGMRLLQSFSSNKTNYIPLIEDLGLYYQIRDDYLNLMSADYQQGKTFCEDLTEGKFSFPIIKAISYDTSDHRLQNILKQKTESVELKQSAIEYIKQTGAMEYTLTVLQQLKERIILEIEKLGGNPFFMIILEKLEQSSI